VEAGRLQCSAGVCGPWNRDPDARRSAGSQLRAAGKWETKLRAGNGVGPSSPWLNVGKPGVQVLSDGWTAVTEEWKF